MKILAIMGSHRSKEMTRSLLDHFLDKIEKGNTVTYFDVNNLEMKHCIACDSCLRKQGECVFKDDMQKVYPAIMEANLVVIASPVYFSAFPSKLKILIDRLQMVYNLKDNSQIVPKEAVLLCTGGAKHYKNQFVACETTMEWVLNPLRAKLTGMVTFSDTDHVIPLKNSEKMEELQVLINRINKK